MENEREEEDRKEREMEIVRKEEWEEERGRWSGQKRGGGRG